MALEGLGNSIVAGKKEGFYMTDKELRKLNRKELLEILLTQSQHIKELQEQLAEAKEKLCQRTIEMEKSGTLAEAALRLNHIFADADAAGMQYVLSLQATVTREKDVLRRLEQKEQELQEKIDQYGEHDVIDMKT
jgi:TusA-related sulfurtransferase